MFSLNPTAVLAGFVVDTSARASGKRLRRSAVFDGRDDQHGGAAGFVDHAGDGFQQGFFRFGFGKARQGESGGDDAVDDGGQCPVVFGDVLSEEDGVALAFVEIAVDWPVQFFAVFVGDPLLGTAGGIDGVFDGEDERAASGIFWCRGRRRIRCSGRPAS